MIPETHTYGTDVTHQVFPSEQSAQFATLLKMPIRSGDINVAEYGQASPVGPFSTRHTELLRRTEFRDKEYRSAYAEAVVEQGIAWQIKANRLARGKSQRDLAAEINTQQSAISRLEDPTSPPANLTTLLKLAEVFDCGLSVKFVRFGELATDSMRLTPSDLTVPSYLQELSESKVMYGK